MIGLQHEHSNAVVSMYNRQVTSIHMAVVPHVGSFLPRVGADFSTLVVIRVSVISLVHALLELFVAGA